LIQSISMKKHLRKILLLLLLSTIILSACGEAPEVEQEPLPTITPSSYSVSIPPYIPEPLVDTLGSIQIIEISGSLDGSNFQIDVSAEDPIIEWVYVLAAPFSNLEEGVAGVDLQAFWQGNAGAGFPADVLFMDGSTKAVFEKIWGPASTSIVKVISSNALLGRVWENENAFAIIPFEQLKMKMRLRSFPLNSWNLPGKSCQ